MQNERQESTLETLQEIRSIMDRSSRFISLSGWSGIWAGLSALGGAFVAHRWMQYRFYKQMRYNIDEGSFSYFDTVAVQFITLALVVFGVALVGAWFFTWRKTQAQKQTMWNKASRQMYLHLFFPLAAGGVFVMAFIYYGVSALIAPACLAFYGLALVGASRYTLPDIRYLGILEVILGCICLFFPGYGLYFWALGFGGLHILYGIIMWNKYDK